MNVDAEMSSDGVKRSKRSEVVESEGKREWNDDDDGGEGKHIDTE